MSYELHPLCAVFPRLVGAEFDSLRDDIKANGLRSPIVLHEGMILDGGNRYRACLDAGVDPRFVEFAGSSLVSFVWSVNGERRHLTPSQRAAIVASLQDWEKAQTRGGDRRSDQSTQADFGSVKARRAASGVGRVTQLHADKIARADPALAVKVAHGELSLNAALVQLGSPVNADRIKNESSQPHEETPMQSAGAEPHQPVVKAPAVRNDFTKKQQGQRPNVEIERAVAMLDGVCFILKSIDPSQLDGDRSKQWALAMKKQASSIAQFSRSILSGN